MPEPPRTRSALQFVLDVTGGRDVVYRVVVYLQDLVQQLESATGFHSRARIDLILLGAQSAQIVTSDRLVGMAAHASNAPEPTGASLRPLIDQLKQLPFEGGGFHTFVLLTRNLAAGWENDMPTLQALVGSVTGLCCGPECSPTTATALSKEPGGTRVVNPLDTIRIQFDAIAVWLIANFADKPAPVREMPNFVLEDPSIDFHNAPTVRYADLGRTRPLAASIPATPQPPPASPPSTAKWRVIEPADRADATEHERAARVMSMHKWQMIGASRRGKLHAHEGTYRDDEFAISAFDRWNLAAVADGAGSCRLSRVGARIATDAAIISMKRQLESFGKGENPDPLADLRAAIAAGFSAAHAAVHGEAQRRAIPVRDLSSTLLLLIHGPNNQNAPAYVATGQIGDGMVLLVGDDRVPQLLGVADKGYYAGETVFLPSTSAKEWAQGTTVTTLTAPPHMVLVMTDGVADDLVPVERQAPTLINGLEKVITERQPDAALLETIGYEKRDSADDRTLVVLYRIGGR